MSIYKEYEVHMQWDSYEGSPFVETRTTWVTALNNYEAEQKARNQFSQHKGFKITDVNVIK